MVQGGLPDTLSGGIRFRKLNVYPFSCCEHFIDIPAFTASISFELAVGVGLFFIHIQFHAWQFPYGCFIGFGG